MKYLIFVLSLLVSANSFAGPSESCETPKIENIMLSGYGPGCSGDSGGDEATPNGLKPTKYQLGGKGKVVLAAAPMRMPSCAKSKCYKMVSGNLDSDSNQKLSTALNQKTFYFDDLCPGCKTKTVTNKQGQKEQKGGRIDLSMNCSDAKNFRVQNVKLKPVDCEEDPQVMAEIKKAKGDTQIAQRSRSGPRRSIASVRGGASR